MGNKNLYIDVDVASCCEMAGAGFKVPIKFCMFCGKKLKEEKI